MSVQTDTSSKVTNATLKLMKDGGEKIAAMTAYDAAFAMVLDQAGVDFVLVGDSVGMVVQGRETTIPVTVDEIIYHTQLVSRGLSRALLMSERTSARPPLPIKYQGVDKGSQFGIRQSANTLSCNTRPVSSG